MTTPRFSLQATASVTRKECLHIFRDWRILILLLVLPPVFTLIFGHAFETPERSDVPALLTDADGSPRSQRFLDLLAENKTFRWRRVPPSSPSGASPAEGQGTSGGGPDLLRNGVRAALVIPTGWGESLVNGDPRPLRFFVDGSDTNTVDELEGRLQESLGKFQLQERQDLIDALPEDVIEMGKKLPVEVRKRFVSAMEPWSVSPTILYNPQERYIEYVLPGIIGLILQLLTVTLTACTIARERESGTLYQLTVTSLRRGEIVVGKVLPYLAISAFLILVIVALAGWHFQVSFHAAPTLTAVCLLFLLCSLGLGLLISAFSRTQTQAIQLSVFFLLPIFVLSGAFAPLDQLPDGVRPLSECFPLTHFCRAFRLVNLYRAPLPYVLPDLAVLFLGALLTFGGAALLLRRVQE